MSAVCGDQGGRDPGRVSLQSSVVSGCAWGALAAGVLCSMAACSEEQYNPPTGGSTGGSAGQTASAGAAGASGGTAGAAAGNAGSAGSGSTGPGMSFTFASSLEEFRINYYCVGPQAADPANCGPVMAAAPPPLADAGGDAAAEDGGATLPPPAAGNDFFATEFDATLGNPDPGSAKITLQFSVDGQLADFARNFGSSTAAGLNLAGKTLTVQARVEAGGAPTVAGKVYIKTGAMYSYADSGEAPLTPGSWTTLRYATPSFTADPAVYDISDVREIGIEILGRGATAVTPTVVHIDTIAY
jgi:hypothetical protein